MRMLSRVVFLAIVLLICSGALHAQGGPPLITNDPSTPGNGNWEINLGVMPELTRSTHNVQLPQFDLNYGVGKRFQFTYEIPFVWQSATGVPKVTGWGNAEPGIKWRFIDRGEGGWNVSTFPQFLVGGSSKSVRNGIAEDGTTFVLPIEISKRIGRLDVDLEVGYAFPVFHSRNAHNERILGLALGHRFTPKFELVGEVFDDKTMGADHDTIFDVGGRYQFLKGLVFLFTAGGASTEMRAVSRNS